MNYSILCIHTCIPIKLYTVYALSQVQPVKSLVFLSGLHWCPGAAEELTATTVL